MNKPIPILTAIIGALVVGCMSAYRDIQKYGSDFQAHPMLPVVILTGFFGASLSVMFFYFVSRWLYRRKERKLKKAGEDKFYDEVARELQDKPMIPGLWTKAFAEMGGDDAKARALYIKYRVAQLAAVSQQQLEENRVAKQRLEKQQKSEIKAAEKQRIAEIEATARRGRTSLHRYVHLVFFIILIGGSVWFFARGAICMNALFAGNLTAGKFVEIILDASILFVFAYICARPAKHCYKEMQ